MSMNSSDLPTFATTAPMVEAFKGPSGLPLPKGDDTARPLAVGDVVEWEDGAGTPDSTELRVLAKLRDLPSRKGVVTAAGQCWYGKCLTINYGGLEFEHRIEHPEWGRAVRVVRVSDGERF